jgi:hypothetical protein
MHFIFLRWINETWLKFALLSAVMSVVIIILSFVYHQGIALHIFGSIFLSISVLAAWFFFLNQKKSI